MKNCYFYCIDKNNYNCQNIKINYNIEDKNNTNNSRLNKYLCIDNQYQNYQLKCILLLIYIFNFS